MNNEKIDYFFNKFDYLIQSGTKSCEALLETAESYAEVFYNKKETKEKEIRNNVKEFTDNLKKLSKEINEQLEKLYSEKEIENEILIEKIARTICEDRGYDPYYHEQGSYPYIDIYHNSIPHHYRWRNYTSIAKKILKEINYV